MVGTRVEFVVDLGADETLFRSQVSECEIEGSRRRRSDAAPRRLARREEVHETAIVKRTSRFLRLFVGIFEEGEVPFGVV